MRIILAGLLALAAFPALAADVTWTWNNPTLNTDGSAIPVSGAGSLTTGRFEFGTCGTGGAFGTKAGEIPLTAAMVAAKSVKQTDILPSTICGRVFVSNTYARESGASNVASVTVQPPTPGNPAGLSVSVSVTVTVNP